MPSCQRRPPMGNCRRQKAAPIRSGDIRAPCTKLATHDLSPMRPIDFKISHLPGLDFHCSTDKAEHCEVKSLGPNNLLHRQLARRIPAPFLLPAAPRPCTPGNFHRHLRPPSRHPIQPHATSCPRTSACYAARRWDSQFPFKTTPPSRAVIS